MNLVSRIGARSFSRATLGLCFCLICLTNASAAENPLTLDEAIASSLADAPQIRAAQATLEGAQDLAPSADRLPDPEAIVGVDNLPLNTVDQFSLTRDFMTMRKIGIMQSVPNGTKRRLRGELAAREIDVAQAELQASRFEIAKAASNAWIACAVSEQSLKRLRDLRVGLDAQSSA